MIREHFKKLRATQIALVAAAVVPACVQPLPPRDRIDNDVPKAGTAANPSVIGVGGSAIAPPTPANAPWTPVAVVVAPRQVVTNDKFVVSGLASGFGGSVPSYSWSIGSAAISFCPNDDANKKSPSPTLCAGPAGALDIVLTLTVSNGGASATATKKIDVTTPTNFISRANSFFPTNDDIATITRGGDQEISGAFVTNEQPDIVGTPTKFPDPNVLVVYDYNGDGHIDNDDACLKAQGFPEGPPVNGQVPQCFPNLVPPKYKAIHVTSKTGTNFSINYICIDANAFRNPETGLLIEEVRTLQDTTVTDTIHSAAPEGNKAHCWFDAASQDFAGNLTDLVIIGATNVVPTGTGLSATLTAPNTWTVQQTGNPGMNMLYRLAVTAGGQTVNADYTTAMSPAQETGLHVLYQLKNKVEMSSFPLPANTNHQVKGRFGNERGLALRAKRIVTETRVAANNAALNGILLVADGVKLDGSTDDNSDIFVNTLQSTPTAGYDGGDITLRARRTIVATGQQILSTPSNGQGGNITLAGIGNIDPLTHDDQGRFSISSTLDNSGKAGGGKIRIDAGNRPLYLPGIRTFDASNTPQGSITMTQVGGNAGKITIEVTDAAGEVHLQNSVLKSDGASVPAGNGTNQGGNGNDILLGGSTLQKVAAPLGTNTPSVRAAAVTVGPATQNVSTDIVVSAQGGNGLACTPGSQCLGGRFVAVATGSVHILGGATVTRGGGNVFNAALTMDNQQRGGNGGAVVIAAPVIDVLGSFDSSAGNSLYSSTPIHFNQAASPGKISLTADNGVGDSAIRVKQSIVARPGKGVQQSMACTVPLMNTADNRIELSAQAGNGQASILVEGDVITSGGYDSSQKQPDVPTTASDASGFGGTHASGNIFVAVQGRLPSYARFKSLLAQGGDGDGGGQGCGVHVFDNARTDVFRITSVVVSSQYYVTINGNTTNTMSNNPTSAQAILLQMEQDIKDLIRTNNIRGVTVSTDGSTYVAVSGATNAFVDAGSVARLQRTTLTNMGNFTFITDTAPNVSGGTGSRNAAGYISDAGSFRLQMDSDATLTVQMLAGIIANGGSLTYSNNSVAGSPTAGKGGTIFLRGLVGQVIKVNIGDIFGKGGSSVPCGNGTVRTAGGAGNFDIRFGSNLPNNPNYAVTQTMNIDIGNIDVSAGSGIATANSGTAPGGSVANTADMRFDNLDTGTGKVRVKNISRNAGNSVGSSTASAPGGMGVCDPTGGMNPNACQATANGTGFDLRVFVMNGDVQFGNIELKGGSAGGTFGSALGGNGSGFRFQTDDALIASAVQPYTLGTVNTSGGNAVGPTDISGGNGGTQTFIIPTSLNLKAGALTSSAGTSFTMTTLTTTPSAGKITHTGPASNSSTGQTPVTIDCGAAGSAVLTELSNTSQGGGCIDANFSCKTSDICQLP